MTLTVEGWMEHFARTGESLHVVLNGEDVTRRCYLADDEAGTVSLFKVNEHGRKYYDHEAADVAREHLVGCVEIRPGEPFRPLECEAV